MNQLKVFSKTIQSNFVSTVFLFVNILLYCQPIKIKVLKIKSIKVVLGIVQMLAKYY